MNHAAMTRLQNDIDAALHARDQTVLERVTLDYGSEDTDLTLVADVRFWVAGGSERLFAVVSRDFVTWLFAPERDHANPPHEDAGQIYTTGGPLAIVREISGDIIVRAILRYLLLEEWRNGL